MDRLKGKRALMTGGTSGIGMPNTSVYSASKAAILSLVNTLSGELISRGIRLNAVSPGPIETPIYDKLGMAKNSKAAPKFHATDSSAEIWQSDRDRPCDRFSGIG